MSLIIEHGSWEHGDYGPEEIKNTLCTLRIAFGDNVATRVDDTWSHSTRDQVRLSAYALATWFASSWWRLLYELTPNELNPRTLSWNMAHEISAAGHGFLWPPIHFESDGETVNAYCSPSLQTATEPIHYINRVHDTFKIEEFKNTIDHFIRFVLNRLDVLGLTKTDLHSLWNEVCKEQENAATAKYRLIEARLGYEPDEAPDATVQKLIDLIPVMGSQAIEEIAPICVPANEEQFLKDILTPTKLVGIEGTPLVLSSITHEQADPSFKTEKPWARGRRLAQIARKEYNLGDGPVTNAKLSELLGITMNDFNGIPQPITEKYALSLGFRPPSTPNKMQILFRRKLDTGRRFEAVRLFCDHMITPPEEHLLPSTDFKTARQMTQRAFAAEFLAPIESLKSLLNRNYSDESIEEIAQRFIVSPLAIRSHLANHGLISSDDVPVAA